MNFAEIKAEVISLTDHPESDAVIVSAVKAATLRLHHTDYYARDLQEAKVTLLSSDYVHQFNAKATFMRYRALNYLRKWDPTGQDSLTQLNTGAPGNFFKILDPAQILDGYGSQKDNIAYVAGDLLNIRSNTQVQMLLAGWYAHPLVTDTSKYTSWIADDVPYAIIFDACSIVFQTFAMQDQARKYDNLVAEQLQMVRMTGLTGKGY
jgi:hypothetical protein